jgi:hypothetical protein
MRKYFLLIIYIVVCTLIGKEFHPFSQFPMYSSFPNYSYTFSLKNERGELVPFRKHFTSLNSGFIAHRYSTFFNHHGYLTGCGLEDSLHLNQAGKELMGMILQDRLTHPFDFDTLYLCRRYYYLKDNVINYQDDLMYAQAVKH